MSFGLEPAGFPFGADGPLWRLTRFSFLGVVELWSGDRMMAVVGEGVLSPRWGWDPITRVQPRLTSWASVFRPSGLAETGTFCVSY
jgi:hypothetical protein